jgi:hypothetical protein
MRMSASNARERLTRVPGARSPASAGKAVDASARSCASSASERVSTRTPARASTAASSTLYSTCSPARARPASTSPPACRATPDAQRSSGLSPRVAVSSTITASNTPSATRSSRGASHAMTPPSPRTEVGGRSSAARSDRRESRESRENGCSPDATSTASADRASGRRWRSDWRRPSQSLARPCGRPGSRGSPARGGPRFATSSNSRTPSEYMSEAGVGGSPRACSGAT